MNNNGQIKALIQLIGSESQEYGAVLKRELAEIIKQNPQQVQDVIEQEFNSTVPAALIGAMEEICWDDLRFAFADYASKINPDLEEGLYLLSKFVNPAVIPGEINQALDLVAKNLRPALLNSKDAAEIANAMQIFFFRSLKMTVLPANLDIKDISFGRFLRKKRGSSLCMAALYMLVGQRYGLDVNIVDLAGRILVQLCDLGSQEPLFIDPLDNGKTLSTSECKEYILMRQIEWNEDFTSPLSSRTVMRRFIANMIFVLNKIKDERRLSYLRSYLEIIKG